METEHIESTADEKSVLDAPLPRQSREKLTPVDTKLLPDQDIAYEADTGASPQEPRKSVGELAGERARRAVGE